MDNSTIYSYLQIIIAAFAVLASLYKFFKYITRKLRGYYDQISKVHEKIDFIFKEVTPNHGSSLKDKINGIDLKLEENTRLTQRIFSKQRWMLDHQNTMIFEADKSGKTLWVNKFYAEFIKRDTSDLLQNGWKNTIHEDDRERVIAHWNECVKDDMTFEDIYHIVDKDGNKTKVKAIANKQYDGSYMGAITIIGQ